MKSGWAHESTSCYLNPGLLYTMHTKRDIYRPTKELIMFSASDPLRLNYWRRRLRDVRDLLSQAALDKLKQKCPTLFNMGWFKVYYLDLI